MKSLNWTTLIISIVAILISSAAIFYVFKVKNEKENTITNNKIVKVFTTPVKTNLPLTIKEGESQILTNEIEGNHLANFVILGFDLGFNDVFNYHIQIKRIDFNELLGKENNMIPLKGSTKNNVEIVFSKINRINSNFEVSLMITNHSNHVINLNNEKIFILIKTTNSW